MSTGTSTVCAAAEAGPAGGGGEEIAGGGVGFRTHIDWRHRRGAQHHTVFGLADIQAWLDRDGREHLATDSKLQLFQTVAQRRARLL